MTDKYYDHGIIARITDVVNEPRTMLTPLRGYAQLPLISLEDSVESIQDILPDIRQQAWTAKERCSLSSTQDNLSHDESAAILLYTMEWEPQDQSVYFVLNRLLRSEDRRRVKPFYSYLKLLLTALWKLPPVCRTVFRGVNTNLEDAYVKNQSYTWWGFSSTTETLDKTEEFLGTKGNLRTLFAIECTNGRQINRHSYFKTENEVLLPPATHFQVVSKINPSKDLHIIQLKEIKPKFPLLEPPFTSSTILPVTHVSYPLHKTVSNKDNPNVTDDTENETVPKVTQMIPVIANTGLLKEHQYATVIANAEQNSLP
ncbi:unnamed protein product, partial [Didymodactylos carnosus]